MIRGLMAVALYLVAGAFGSAALADDAAQAGSALKDCPVCPEMVVVPAGSFTMGNDAHSRESPTHKVTIAKPFAVGKFDVTFDEWDACVADGGCGALHPDDHGWGRGTRPVMNVSWINAHSYINWIGQKTGKRYRLLSEAEWEYVARAGSSTKYWWGDEMESGYGNCMGCGSELGGSRTAPAGSFKPNPFGLYDTMGNLSVWVQDSWHSDYSGAPADGSAWEPGDPKRRVFRNGSWNTFANSQYVSFRNAEAPTTLSLRIGFRVARDLP